MKKRIVIEEFDNTNNNLINKLVSNKFAKWLLYMVCYAIVLVTVSCMFHKTFYISNQYYGLYAVIAAIVIYILNQTIKPILFYLTLPITALTMGLFYPIINVLILYITSFILGDKFQIHGFILPFFIAIVISVLNILMEGMVIKPIINKEKDRNE